MILDPNSQQPEGLLAIQSPNLGDRAHHAAADDKDLAALSEPVMRNIQTIIELETDHHRTVPHHFRILERVAASCTHPRFLYGQLVFVLAWWGCSSLSSIGILPKDFPKFNLRTDGLSVASILISTGVLVYQSRQEQLAEERSHLMLQIDLLTEQKIGKLISLMEELRRDLPNVRNRVDTEAEEMQSPIDPHALLTALKESLDPTEGEVQPEPPTVAPQTLVDPDKAPIVLPTHLG